MAPPSSYKGRWPTVPEDARRPAPPVTNRRRLGRPAVELGDALPGLAADHLEEAASPPDPSSRGRRRARSRPVLAPAKAPRDSTGALLGKGRRRDPEGIPGEPKARRRPMLSVLGLLVVVACAGGGAAVARGIDRSKPYLVVERFVAAGQILAAADLRSVDIVTPPGLAIVPTADAGAVVGRRLAVPVLPGSLLSAGDLAGLSPQGDETLVGTSLDSSQMPGTLQVGDPVLVVLDAAGATPSETGALASARSTSAGAGVLCRATVAEITSPTEPGGTAGSEIVTLAVPESSAAAVSEASAGGAVSLAELPPRTAGP